MTPTRPPPWSAAAAGRRHRAAVLPPPPRPVLPPSLAPELHSSPGITDSSARRHDPAGADEHHALRLESGTAESHAGDVAGPRVQRAQVVGREAGTRAGGWRVVGIAGRDGGED